MGASESKLVFKQGIFRLQEAKPIAADDTYWTGFWQLPESTEDVFTLFSAADIRRTRDVSLTNLETLILALTSRLFFLTRHASFPDQELAPEKEALNCIRVLTRILPFIYEADNLEPWDDKFFWGMRRVRKRRKGKTEVLFEEVDAEMREKDIGDEFEDRKPLAEELIDTLMDLLFYSDFTLARNERTNAKVTYSIWSSGVGCNTPVPSNARLENNRTEVLRLLTTLAGKSMYMSPNVLPTKGVRAITYIATCPDKQIVLSVLCSLLNTTLKFNPASWKIPYDHLVIGDPKHLYIASSLQFLLVLLLYPIPEESNGSTPKNFFRHFLGRVHRPEDFQFICDGLSRTLHQPLAATSSYLPGSQKPVRWSPEMIMLFWEMVQCNKRFRAFVVETERGSDFLILVLFYAMEHRNDPTKQGIVRMCVFVLQTLSMESSFGKSLNKEFFRQETLPPVLRLESWSGSYGDFLVVSLHTLITGSKGKLDTIYPALLAIMNNVSPYLENLNRLACLKLLQLYVRMSSPSFLLANESNHQLLTSLLHSINAIIEHKYAENSELVSNILKHRKRFESLRSFTLESAQEEVEKLAQQRKESASHGDSDLTSAASSRRASVESLRSPASVRSPPLSNVPEESAFTIGDDSDDDDEPLMQRTQTNASRTSHSRTASIASSENVEDAVPTQLRGMSEKARGKLPANMPSFNRVNSISSISSVSGLNSPGFGPPGMAFQPSPQWIESWLPVLPLHTILTLISYTSTHQPDSPNQPPPALPPGIEPDQPKIHLFEWSPLSLGWYESLLWSCICSAEMAVGKGTVGVWNGTNIRLFRVERDLARPGPTLLQPRGAIDAVGNGLVQRIGSLGLGGQNNQHGSNGGGSPRVG